MANVDRPNGLTAIKHRNGSTPISTNSYTIASGLAANIYVGDAIKSTGTGKGITIAAAGNTMRGVFDGCSYTDSTGASIFSKSWVSGTVATNVVAYVYDDPDIIFSVQNDGSLAATDIGQAVDLLVGSGNSRTERSTSEADTSSIGSTGGLLILELGNEIDNAYGTNAKINVLISEHELGRGAYTAV